MKKIISVITLTAILFSILLTGPVSASAVSSDVELKKAIEIAKTAFDFDASKLDFSSSYSEIKNGRKLWYLNWYSSTGSGQSFNVTVDAATGEIINMNQWESSPVQTRKIPKYTREEALKVAEALASRLHPDKFNNVKLVDEYTNNLIRPYYGSDIYSFYFMRQVNGIDFQDNGIQVQVDKNTLKVKYFNLDWETKVPVPDSKKAITSAAAKKIYADKLGLELAYQMIYPSNSSDKPELVLVYIPKNTNNPIDAITGEIIKQPYYGPMYAAAQEKMAMGGDMGRGVYVPTPQEQKVLDASSKFISKEQAVEALKKYLKFDSKFNMDSSSLYGGQNMEDATWHFSWSYTDRTNNTYEYLYGAVDAVTGEVKNFSISSSENEYKPNVTAKYTKEQCREIAEKFLKEIQPAKFNNSEYREQYYDAYLSQPNVSVYNFNYIRKENGISAPFNSLNVTVSAYTGKVISYYMNWNNNLEFPDAAGTISLEEAYIKLYAKHDLKLKYIRIYDYSKNSENMIIKLAYMLDNFYGMIDAKSGQFIDYNGKPIVETVKASYTDIEGHKYEKDIKLLVELGILDAAESKFNPDAKVLQKDFVKLLMKATQPEYYYPMPYVTATADNSDYDRYYENAFAQNILAKADKKPEAAVTKMDASKMMVKALGIGFVADLGNIFNLNVTDAADITAENKGYAAIAAALGIADTSNGSFSPAAELTRGETAAMIVNYLRVEKNPAPAAIAEPAAEAPVMMELK